MTRSTDHTDQRLRLTDKLYQRSIWDAVVPAGRGERLAAPVVVEIDMTTACDFICPDCISRPLLNQGQFTSERLASLAAELVSVGVRAVVLTGGGEPLAHPGASEVIRILSSGGVHVGVVTSGTLIKRHMETLCEHTSWVRASIDAGCAATYAVFRPHKTGISMFDSVMANMEAIGGHSKGALGYSFLLNTRLDARQKVVATNYNEVLTAGTLAKRIGCDYFEVKPVYDHQHYLVPQPAHLLQVLQDQLRQLRAIESDRFRVIHPSTLRVVLDQQSPVEPKSYSRCLVAELRTVLAPSGAFICSPLRGYARMRYGDPTRQTFKEMWRGEVRQRVMEDTRPCVDCRFHCARHSSNLELAAIGAGERHGPVRHDYDLFI